MGEDGSGQKYLGAARAAVSAVLLVGIGVLLVLIYQTLPLGVAGGEPPASPTPVKSSHIEPTATSLSVSSHPTPTPSPLPTATELPPTPSPTTPPTVEPTTLPAIIVEQPAPGNVVSNPVRIAGTASVFEGTVNFQLVDADGQVLGKGFTTATEGGPGRGSFSADLEFRQPAQRRECQVQVFTYSAKDGSVQDLVVIPVFVEGAAIERTPTATPQAFARSDAVRAEVSDVSPSARVIRGTDAAGRPVEIALDDESRVVSASGQRLALSDVTPGNLIEVSGRAIASRPGAMLAREVTLLAEAARRVVVYYPTVTQNDVEFVAVPRLIVHTPAIGTATINELLRGPTPEEQASGLSNPIPSAARLLSLRIIDGVAYADFNRGLEEGVGGSLRVMTIRRSIDLTLRQFYTVQEVVISIEGRTEDILQP